MSATILEDAVAAPDAAMAAAAEARQDYAEAAQQWRRVVDEHPDDVASHLRLIAALEKSGQAEQADAAALANLGRFADDAKFIIEYGGLAARRNDPKEALRRWEGLELTLSDDPWICIAKGFAFCNVGQLEAADAMFAEAARRSPSSLDIAVVYALHPSREARWPEAVERFRNVMKTFPNDPRVHSQLGHVLRMAGEKKEAEQVLNDAALQYPADAAIAVERVRCLDLAPEAAIDHWRQVVARFPDEVDGLAELGAALRRHGDKTESEVLLRSTNERFPNNYTVALEYAEVMVDRMKWQPALELLQRNVVCFPKVEHAKSRLAQLRWVMSLDSLLNAPPAAAGDQAAVTYNDAKAALLAEFEGLGGNCEFGLLQRHHGAEPLGLLRFSAVHVDSVIDMLNTKFEGIGQPENTRLVARGDEFIVSDTRFGMASHTFVSPFTVEQDSFFKEQCRRLTFLRRKLLRDLSEREKTFVYNARYDPSDEKGKALHAALSSYGPNRLLYVRAAGAAEEPGSVRMIEPGLCFGYLDQYGDRDDGGWNISYDVWLRICQNALDLFGITSGLRA